MKKNFIYSVMALFVMLLAASCSQEEIISTNGSNGGKVVLSVNVSGSTPNSRAVADVEGYVMRCIMEAVDANGTVIEGTRMVQAVTGGKATFEFEKNKDAANYLFWADYVQGTDINNENATIYNAATLTNISYRLNKTNTLFNNPAADAFCSSVGATDLATNVTLKRPFTRIGIKTADINDLGLTGLDRITPNIYCGSGFSVLSGIATTKGQIQQTAGQTVPVLTDGELAFYCFTWATVADETRISGISFSNEDGDSKNIQITADQMQNLKGNTSVSLKPSETADKIKVEIDIDNSFESEGGQEPGEGEDQPAGALQVGSYINANGEVVTESTSAVAVVFSMADGKTDNSNYDGKTVKGYAVSLNKAINRQRLGDCSVFSLADTDDTNNAYAGYSFSNNIKTAFEKYDGEKTGYQIFNGFFNNNLLTAVTGTNLSGWYIPSIAQVTDFLTLDNETLKTNLKAAYQSNYYCVSSTVTEGTVKGALIDIATGTSTKSENMAASASGLIFPVLTIFE